MITCFYLTLSPLNFLQVIHQKPKKTLHEITNELCPVRRLSSIFLFCSCSSLLFLKYGCFFYFSEEKKFLFLYRILIRCFSFIIHMAIFYQVLSIQQLYRISTMYWDDKYGTHTVSSDVRSCTYSFNAMQVFSSFCFVIVQFACFLISLYGFCFRPTDRLFQV